MLLSAAFKFEYKAVERHMVSPGAKQSEEFDVACTPKCYANKSKLSSTYIYRWPIV